MSRIWNKSMITCLVFFIIASVTDSKGHVITSGSFFEKQYYFTDSSDTEKKIDKFIAPYVKSNNFSGSILVKQDGKILFNKCYGMANFELNVPVSSKTKFNIASVSKSFTAAAILLLQERGLLDVKHHINRYLYDFPNGNKITIHNLLVHNSGLPRLLSFPDYETISKNHFAVGDVVDLFKNKTLQFQPGERSEYSNANFVLLAFIIEKISGLTFNEYLKVNFFGPLQMSNTILHTGNKKLISNRAQGYEVVGFDEIENKEYSNPSLFIGASSIYSTTYDLNIWMESLLSKRILDSNSTIQMLNPIDGSKPYGCCVASKRLGRDVYVMEGWDIGFASNLTHFPNEKLTITVLSNIGIITLKTKLVSNIAAIVLGEDFSSQEIDIEPVEHELAHKMSGTYKFGDDFYNPGGEMYIVEKGGFLYDWQKKSGRFVGLMRISESEFIHRSSWGTVKFDTDQNGKVTGLFIYGYYRAEKIQ